MNKPFIKGINDYAPLSDFIKDGETMTYSEFDANMLKSLNLFVIPKDEHFVELEIMLDGIIRALPALKRIFARPIIRLKDELEILPVESVRIINNQSISHVSYHSELWADITEKGLKPKKLMTFDREEEYAIYENIAFVRLINIIFSFISKNIRMLKDIMYAYRDMKINLLDRTNHLSYFLAAGKLHMGYIRAQDQSSRAYERCVDKLLFIEKILRSKLKSPIYRICKKRKDKIKLKKTNIFRNHKDYRQVYKLLKMLSDEKEFIDTDFTNTVDLNHYKVYCNMLSVFAVGHFNFNFTQKKKIDFNQLNTECKFKGWTLKMENLNFENMYGLRFSVKKDYLYRVTLVFNTAEKVSSADLESFKVFYPSEEFVIVSPNELTKKYTYLSIYDVESFRRVQQIIFKAMIYADKKRDVCPFCGLPLSEHEDGYICSTCQTVIMQRICPTTEQKFFITDMGEFKKPMDEEKDKFLQDKVAEAQQNFRNITPLSLSGEIICPHCGKVHEN